MKREQTGSNQVNLRLPEVISNELAEHVKKTRTTRQAVLLEIIAEHYGIEAAAPQRGRPKSVESE